MTIPGYYSGVRRKQAKLNAAVQRTAEITEEHLATLIPAQAKAMRKDIHRLAIQISAVRR